MSETEVNEVKEQDLKAMKHPVVDVTVVKKYIVKVQGELIGEFSERNQMCGMKELVDDNGHAMVLDFDTAGLSAVISQLMGGESDPMKVGVVKVAPSIYDLMLEVAQRVKKRVSAPVGGEEVSDD